MQLVIDIPDGCYEELNSGRFPVQDAYRLVAWVKNGTPLPKGATNGDIIKTLFPNAEINYGLNGIVGVKFIHMTVFDLDWWNAPYKREDKE